ncbi:MAG TPA: UbiD family decarboxylase, partial [Candidatus Dormibacteraeota bacterium]|nr:UbiD family decarboxylase [Candidatus Dormibacteraeota bacterium]
RAMANPIAPILVSSPPCQQVVLQGNDLRKPGGGLASLPVPISTPGFDAAPYLTATLCITRDPETGIRNAGTYRAALKKTDRLGVRMASRIGGAGGYLHWLKYRALGKPMPCAIVIGSAPIVTYTGPQKFSTTTDELTIAGGAAGVPVRTAKCVTLDLEVPADSEIVIEGYIDSNLLEPEGPFGESNGYVALEDYNMIMQVTAITHRENPVFASILSQVTPSESSVIKKVAYEPMFLAHLRDQLSIRGIRRVVVHEPLSNVRPIIFLQFANGTPRTEVWRGMQGAAAKQADCGKIVIAVSEDIDPANTDAVMWSLAYRSNPTDDVHVEPYRSRGHAPKSGPESLDSTMLIDATLKHPMPPLALPGRKYMERAQVIWEELGLPAITVRAPWHGYSLGDWGEPWEAFARNAVAGDWMKNGENTAARRRGGLTPETPVRNVEGHEKPQE